MLQLVFMAFRFLEFSLRRGGACSHIPLEARKSSFLQLNLSRFQLVRRLHTLPSCLRPEQGLYHSNINYIVAVLEVCIPHAALTARTLSRCYCIVRLYQTVVVESWHSQWTDSNSPRAIISGRGFVRIRAIEASTWDYCSRELRRKGRGS